MAAFAFKVWVDGTEHETIINHATASKAKYQFWRAITEHFPGTPITKMRAKKIGPPITSEHLARIARYRGMPNVKAGQRVRAGDLTGVVVDGNSSANFNVLLDKDCPRWPGQILNIHPGEITLI